MDPIPVSKPKTLRIAAIQKITSISLGLFPFFFASPAKADVGNAASLRPRIEISQPATHLSTDQPRVVAPAGLETEVNEYNQSVAAFNREVVMLRHLEHEIRNMACHERSHGEALDGVGRDAITNSLTIRRNAKINDFNNRARRLRYRKTVIERNRNELTKRQRSMQTILLVDRR